MMGRGNISTVYMLSAFAFFVFAVVLLTQVVNKSTFRKFRIVDEAEQLHTDIINRQTNAPHILPQTTDLFKLGVFKDSGQRELDQLRANSIAFDLINVNISEMTEKQVYLTLHSYLDNADTVCKRRLRMGDIEDGGWEICDDVEYRPVPPCVIYSLGIGGDWSFDDESSKLYQCHVYSFDPSIGKPIHNRSDLVHFYNWGIDGWSHVNSKGWQMYTLEAAKAKLNHTYTTIDLIKMDIESSEWPALPDMLRTGQLKGVKQLLLEFHIPNTRKHLTIVQDLERFGFRKFYSHKNVHCKQRTPVFPVMRTLCYEVHYIKVFNPEP